VIGLLPTGGGKSLTYQLAAMLQPGITIVIDPLRALMKDQYDGLINNGIDTCTFIYYTLRRTEEIDMIEQDKREREKREKQMESSQVQFVFLSPERLCIYRFRERLKRMRDLHVYFAYGVIDEVHCVSEWGHDFRFPYLHLGRNLYNYVCSKDQKKHLTLFGLTATASFDVLADVERELSGDGAFPLDADTIVRYENTNRLELQYKIEKVPVNAAMNRQEVYRAKQNFLREYINQIHIYINELQTETSLKRIKTSFAERQDTDYELINTDLSTNVDANFYTRQEIYSQAGIVFCPHRDNAGISVFKNEIALRPVIPQIGTFTGGGDSDADFTSFNNLELFRDNKLPLMIATKAFGMGIDKPNVRFTVNMNYSDSLESFVQEAGRAGRDRKMALSIILFAEHEADNETVMYFHRNNFKGIEVEKQIMRWLLSKLSMPISHKNDVEFPQTEKVANFLNKLLSTHEGEVIVAFISYNTIIQLYKGIKINRILEQNITTQIFTVELENRTIVNVPEQDIIEIDKAGIDKAIYRMCCIGLIDDFTQDYAKKRFRIVTKRKADGEYYQGLKRFLMRYYSEEKAEQEIQKVPNYRGENEIHKCLGYLTEFIYEKIAVKRKRTIDDMHTFCIQGLDDTKDWKEVNEDLKDFIYFYFNSKYAKDDYETEKGEPFSLTSDTDRGKKSSFDILFKYLRVIDEDVYGSSGSPKDSIKHLQGAVRLIRRSLTDTNAALSMLNVFCLAYLGTNNNETLEEELENSYKEGYMSFFEDEEDKYSFYNNTKNLTEKFKSIPLSKKTLTDIQEWSLHCELNIHNNWLDNFKKSYIK
ncbi:MAG: DEAD/DEAH box helicase, partial [Prevotellaceae bacterium]|nr:DEAD/DEAH box helicase [Prevotellaceae bacterium]